MIFTWMLYCTAVFALLGLGALALERGLSAMGAAGGVSPAIGSGGRPVRRAVRR